MSPVYIVVGIIAFLAGLVILGMALRKRGDSDDPKAAAMLIAGMMVTTFGLLLCAFWIAFATGAPADLNAEAAR
jgi:ABC-type transport system involved in cytochrome c biogenesis permease subunit